MRWSNGMRGVVGATMLLSGVATQAARADDTPIAVQTVDALQAVFGKHPGFRSNHAKGIVCEGTFQAAAGAAALSKAAHLQGGVIPITLRFSDSTGVPMIPDGDANASPHGMAVKFHLPDGSDTDIVVNSLKFFPVSDIEGFRDFLMAVGGSPPGSPKPTKLDAFFASHPAALPAIMSVATPSSFATEQYNGVDAFILVDKAGTRTDFRYRIDPVAGVEHLDAAAAKAEPPNFLRDEITQRLKAGPVSFKMMAQLAAPGDGTKDPTIPWPADRKVVELGTITLKAVVADSATAEKALIFLPSLLTDGVEESDDPLIDQRSAAYAESFGRRSQ